MLHRIPGPRPWTSRFAWLHPKVYLVIHIVLGLLVSATCAWLFYRLADALNGNGRMVRLDHRIAHWVELHNTEAGEHLALAVSFIGHEFLWALIALVTVAYLIRREWPRALLLVIVAGGGAILNSQLKIRFHRGRPIFAAEFSTDGSSFPSGHAMGAFIGYGILAYLIAAHVHHARTRTAIFWSAALLILLVGLTRVYLDVHFFSDVVAGFAAGAVWLFVCISAFRFAHLNRVGE